VSDVFVAAALAAATEVGRRAGLPHDNPEVLAARANVLVRMGPVVARVPATTRIARADTAERLACDLALSAFLAERNAPVIPPWGEPKPHFARDLPVTLWPFTRHNPETVFRPTEIAHLLATLHETLRDYPGELPAGPVAELDRWLDLLADELPVDQLRAMAAKIVLTGPVQPLHGDAHTGNILATPDGPRWLDFEDTWRGPVGWDLACLAFGRGGSAAVAAYPGVQPDLAPFLTLRNLYSVCWRFVIARRFPDRRDEARAALAKFVGAAG
jgi:hypothetical protein